METTADLNGVAIDLRGIAYLLALTQAPRVVDDAHMRTYWRDELEVLWWGAIVSFENAAIRQSEPLRLDLGSVDLEWRPRPLSAAANYYLAARSALSVPFLPQGETLRLARKSEQLLKAAIDRYPDHRDRLEEVLVRWAQELRPRGEPLLVASGE